MMFKAIIGHDRAWHITAIHNNLSTKCRPSVNNWNHHGKRSGEGDSDGDRDRERERQFRNPRQHAMTGRETASGKRSDQQLLKTNPN